MERINVSILLNQQIAPKGGWSAEQLEQIRQMVERAVGFDEARVAIRSVCRPSISMVRYPLRLLNPAGGKPPYWQDSLRYLVGGLLGLTLVFFGIRPLVKHLVRTQQQPEMEMGEAEEDLEPTVGLSMRRDEDDPQLTSALSNSLYGAAVHLDVDAAGFLQRGGIEDVDAAGAIAHEDFLAVCRQRPAFALVGELAGRLPGWRGRI